MACQPTAAQAKALRTWLANGMEKPIPAFIRSTTDADSTIGAIYHLTDKLWIVPALKSRMDTDKIGLVYDAKVEKDENGDPKPNPNQEAIDALEEVKFFPRTKANIMHNKYLVRGKKLLTTTQAEAKRLTCGSANYTTQGLTQQANLVHTFNSPDLATLYLNALQKAEAKSRARRDQDGRWMVEHGVHRRCRHPGLLFAGARQSWR